VETRVEGLRDRGTLRPAARAGPNRQRARTVERRRRMAVPPRFGVMTRARWTIWFWTQPQSGVSDPHLIRSHMTHLSLGKRIYNSVA